MASKRGGRGLVGLILWCILLFPVTVLLHELGHWLVGRLAGFPTHLHYARVSGLPETPPYGDAPGLVALAALAGPAVTLALVAIGMGRQARGWGLPLVAAALPRFAVNVIFMIQQLLVLAGIAKAANPNFDEILAASALAESPVAVAGVGALVLVVGIVWLWRRAGWRAFLALVLGTAIGMAGWLGWAGPRLLP